MIPERHIDLEVESIVFELPRPKACERCGAKEDLRSICGFLVCGSCLEGDL